MKRVGRKMDEILDMLRDLKWHTVDEISKKISQPKPKVRQMLKLMITLGDVEYREGKVRITRKTLEWLRETGGNLY